jgi:hypothetical protein
MRTAAAAAAAALAVAACGGSSTPLNGPNTSSQFSACLAAPAAKPDGWPQAKRPPKVVAPRLLEGHRTTGSVAIYPGDNVKAFLKQQQIGRVVAMFELCIDETGTPRKIEILKSSCMKEYDDLITTTMSAWRYSPYQVDGEAVPICTAVNFIYNQN